MTPPNNLDLDLDLAIFLSIFFLSFSPTSAILPKVHLPLPPASSKLVGDFCNGIGGSLGSHRFCLKALSTAEAATAKDSTQLGVVIMKLGAANGKVTLSLYNDMVKKSGSSETLKALNSCVVAYKYAIQSFEMVSSELVEDPQTANYDVSLVAPEIMNCEKELIDAKVVTPRLHVGNRFMQYYTSMGIHITSNLQLEKPNDY